MTGLDVVARLVRPLDELPVAPKNPPQQQPTGGRRSSETSSRGKPSVTSLNTDVLLSRYLQEVHAHGARAVRPADLDDEWLHVLLFQATNAINHDYDARLTELVGAVVLLLEREHGPDAGPMMFTDDELAEGIERYCFALVLEMASRESQGRTEPATFEGFLLDALSEVGVSRK